LAMLHTSSVDPLAKKKQEGGGDGGAVRGKPFHALLHQTIFHFSEGGGGEGEGKKEEMRGRDRSIANSSTYTLYISFFLRRGGKKPLP